MSLTTEEYERLRMPLLKMLAEAQAQYQRNIEPIRAQLKRLSAIYVPPTPVTIMDMSQIDPEVLGRICGTTPSAPIPSRVTDLPDPPTIVAREPLGPPCLPFGVYEAALGLSQGELACASVGLSQGELACASAVVCTCARYDQRCPLHS